MQKPSELGDAEQITLLAVLISLVALSIDAILPAMTVVGEDFSVADPNAPQFLVSALLLGLSIGQLFYGPISDSVGRRPAIMVGLCVFCAGSLLAYVATSFEGVLLGRFLQGVGAAGPRVVAIAIVRDRHSGPQMARLMSIIMAVFITVPALAPALGQLILWVGGWRDIFLSILLLAASALVWFAIRQPESHPLHKRRKLSVRSVAADMATCLQHPVSRGYAIAAGLVFGAFVGFLTSIQPIFEVAFGMGEWFALYFGILAIAIGMASVTNSRLVLQLGMQRLCRYALTGLIALSLFSTATALLSGGNPSLTVFMLLMLPVCFCFGILFGNFNALSMEPMGHIAGSAAAVIASVTSLIAVSIGTLIGQAFDGTVIALFVGFGLGAMAAAAVVYYTETHGRRQVLSATTTP